MSQDVALVAISFTQFFPIKYNIHRQQKSFGKLDCFFPNNIKRYAFQICIKFDTPRLENTEEKRQKKIQTKSLQ